MKTKENEKKRACPWCGARFKFLADEENHEKKCPKRPVKYEENK